MPGQGIITHSAPIVSTAITARNERKCAARLNLLFNFLRGIRNAVSSVIFLLMTSKIMQQLCNGLGAYFCYIFFLQCGLYKVILTHPFIDNKTRRNTACSFFEGTSCSLNFQN